jgi:flagellar hook-basal body complex protein FliE
MNLAGIGSIGGIAGIGAGAPPLRPAIETDGGAGGFGQMLQDLTSRSQAAETGIQELAVGGESDLHDITLSMEMESLSFDLAVQIRNKLVEGYQEIFRMQV